MGGSNSVNGNSGGGSLREILQEMRALEATIKMESATKLIQNIKNDFQLLADNNPDNDAAALEHLSKQFMALAKNLSTLDADLNGTPDIEDEARAAGEGGDEVGGGGGCGGGGGDGGGGVGDKQDDFDWRDGIQDSNDPNSPLTNKKGRSRSPAAAKAGGTGAPGSGAPAGASGGPPGASPDKGADPLKPNEPGGGGGGGDDGLGEFGGGGMCFEDMIQAMMMKVVSKMQKEAAALLNKIDKMSNKKGGGGSEAPGGGTNGSGPAAQQSGQSGSPDDSRDLMMERLKVVMQKLSQCQQSMSNIINTMHENAMNPIRNIKA